MSKNNDKGRSAPDYDPAKVDFNPKVQPKLPPKMTPAERKEVIDRVAPIAKPKGKRVDSKSKGK